ncbi:MAG: DUF362 domain-containing protein [Geobacteraceae bacterium]|nr:DUF362 domain-containing protein [Geobacteraceae bacterium]
MGETDYSIALSTAASGYPENFPFDPDEAFPEYSGSIAKDSRNDVYRAVRKNFELLGYDRENIGTASWNPLGHLVKPGDRVFIKPNLCSHEYGRKKEKLTGDLFSIITHPSVVRAVADYVVIALKGKGQIVIGDNPTIDTNFAVQMAATGYDRFAAFYRQTHGIDCTVNDLREVWCDNIKFYGNKSLMKKLPGDPLGDTVVNLGEKSFFYNLNALLFRGVFTNRWETIRHHHGKTQEYAVANSIYTADVYISIPKLKTHHKVGATLNVKGLVGMCTKKNYLIHWRIGFPSWGGDEYPEPENKRDHLLLALKHIASDLTPEFLRASIAKRLKGGAIDRMFTVGHYCGSWEGNDTCWRMAADLYLALMSRERKCLSVVDGVIGGDGNGPFCTGRKEAKTIITGEHLVLVDSVSARMMDFNVMEIRYIAELLKRLDLDLAKVNVESGDYETMDFFASKRSYLDFAPPSNWPNLSINASNKSINSGGES